MIQTLLRTSLTLTLLIFLWQATIFFCNLPVYILPTPQQVITALWQQKTLLLTESLPTLLETLLGLAFGILLGCIAALILCFYRPLSKGFLPLLIISQAIPVFAIAPLLVIWLGYGLASKIATTILILFFPITSAFYDGLQRTPAAWLDLAKTMQAKKWRLFWHIRIPAALPALASGIRIATVAAPMGAIIGEWVGATHGLGYLMLNANARMQIDVMFAALIILVALSLALYFCIDKLLRVLVTWE